MLIYYYPLVILEYRKVWYIPYVATSHLKGTVSP